jgi:hypothetical protein
MEYSVLAVDLGSRLRIGPRNIEDMANLREQRRYKK